MSGTAASGASEGLSRTLVLNGLVDLCGGPAVLDDEDSRATLRAAFDAALHVAERDKFERLVADEDPEALDEEGQRFLTTCAAEVLDELVDREVTATLLHDAPLTVSDREAALYSFLVTHDPSALDALAVGDDVRAHLDAGATAVADEAFGEAATAFEDAVTESAGGDGAIAARVLAAYACHRDERDEAAMDYVEEALHLETRAWTAKLVGYAASHRFPEKFRTGKLGGRVFFRWSAEVPDVGDVLVAVGPAGSDGDAFPDPTPIEGSDQCRPFERLWPETTVRVAVSGTLPEVPSVDSYYVATGVADLEVFEARTVEEVLLSGPMGDDATERVRFD
jgi:hypothetical protein